MIKAGTMSAAIAQRGPRSALAIGSSQRFAPTCCILAAHLNGSVSIRGSLKYEFFNNAPELFFFDNINVYNRSTV
jgi:hypothetical protein